MSFLEMLVASQKLYLSASDSSFLLPQYSDRSVGRSECGKRVPFRVSVDGRVLGLLESITPAYHAGLGMKMQYSVLALCFAPANTGSSGGVCSTLH